MKKTKAKKQQQTRRHARVRSQVKGSALKPRLSVYRSNRGMFLQLIDDESGRTLVSAGMKEIKIGAKAPSAGGQTAGKLNASQELGKLIAQKAKDKKITKVVFDRSHYKYHGRTKAAADGARAGGLEF